MAGLIESASFRAGVCVIALLLGLGMPAAYADEISAGAEAASADSEPGSVAEAAELPPVQPPVIAVEEEESDDYEDDEIELV